MDCFPIGIAYKIRILKLLSRTKFGAKAHWTFGERTERSRARLVEMFKIYIRVMKTDFSSKQELFRSRT
jgi:hypothetical protein